jgi:hypothetical protein
LNDIGMNWLLLIKEVRRLEKLPQLSEYDYVVMKKYLGRLGLVQPFDWMHWSAPNLLDVDMDQLDIYDCIRYITRHVRGERFFENFLSPWIRSGVFGDLCETAMRKSRFQPTPLLPKAA